MNTTDENIFRIDPKKISNPLLRTMAKISRPFVEKLLCFKGLNEIYNGARANDKDISFSRKVLDYMDVKWDINAPFDNPIPQEGPVIVVSNHPFGGIEGVILLALLEQYRSDAKVMANYLLSLMPEFREDFFFVDPFGGSEAKKNNLKSMKGCIKWLEEGHLLGVFPAGEVSSIDLKSKLVRDNIWSSTIAKMARRTGATIIPMHICGNNGKLFNLLGLIHPRLRTLQLPKQLVNKKSKTIHIEIGQPILPQETEIYDTDEKLINFMRLRSYALAERPTAKTQQTLSSQTSVTAQEKIIDPIPAEVIEAEIAAFPLENTLCEGDDLIVYCAKSAQIPQTLREIGRLREITYRDVGEGTGTEIDIDQYDEYYRHLFVWNPQKKEIIGAYRLGLADEIMPKLGVKGLYSHTCFNYGDDFVQKLQPAIELGRSWVRKEYQRAYSSLMLLWKGLCIFVAKNPHYKSFFGPVSISNDFLDASKWMLMNSLKLSSYRSDLAALVKSRCAPKPLKNAEWMHSDYRQYIADLETTAKIIQDIEPDQKNIPVLIRQYVKMGGKIVCFNVDPAFNYCLDGFITVNIPDVDHRILKRYMGTEGFEAYQNLHKENK